MKFNPATGVQVVMHHLENQLKVGHTTDESLKDEVGFLAIHEVPVALYTRNIEAAVVRHDTLRGEAVRVYAQDSAFGISLSCKFHPLARFLWVTDMRLWNSVQ